MVRRFADFTYSQLVLIMNNRPEFISFLMENGLLASNQRCPSCQDPMRICISEDPDGNEGRWRCSKQTCRKEKSLRQGSFFEKSKISLKDLVSIIFLWGKGYSSTQIQEETKITNKSVNQWLLFAREVLDDFYFEDTTMIGGPEKVVEIDESVVFTRKRGLGCGSH